MTPDPVPDPPGDATMSPARPAERSPLPAYCDDPDIAAALADEELMRQVRQALDAERRGIEPTPLSEIKERAKKRRIA